MINKEKYIPNSHQIAAFKNVIKAMKVANKAGLVFYGKQNDLFAYTKNANDYMNNFSFDSLLSGKGCTIHHLSQNILCDSGADDIPNYISKEDEPG